MLEYYSQLNSSTMGWEFDNGKHSFVIISGFWTHSLSTPPVCTPLIGGGDGHGISSSTPLIADAVAIDKLAKTLGTLFLFPSEEKAPSLILALFEHPLTMVAGGLVHDNIS